MTLQPILPWWLLLPVMVAVLGFLGWRLYRGAGTAVRTAAERSAGANVRAWMPRSALVLLLLGAALRPGLPGGTAQAATADLNVFFVVDTTTSMVAEDYGNAGPRMVGVRQDIAAIAEELPGARFSVITFDTKAHVRMPLTTDTLALETIISVLEPQVTAYAKGSTITAARKVLAERLTAARQSHPERPRLVYYLGDGEHTSPKEPEALDLADGLVAGGAVLGYGTPGGGRMRENTGRESAGQERPGGSTEGEDAPYVQDSTAGAGGEAQPRDALSRIDEPRLRELAGQLGVPYVHRSSGDPVAPMMQDARPAVPESGGTLERPGSDGSLAGRTELYWILAAGAFVLGLAEAIVIIRRLREVRALVPASAGRRSQDGKAEDG
ncbi:VWA domain-containing protein [Pseudarthrobacter sp. CC4]|uniref:vWA domain-containing protein n=1 Tax=Pseudarthrobacter sp. CC4 TaxID=3029190 RepID=UPI003B8D97BD